MKKARKCLVLKQEKRHFELKPAGNKVTLRILEPSKPGSLWPGNIETIHEWRILEGDNPVYRKCTHEEIMELEKLSGGWRKIRFIDHPTLGEVCVRG